MTFAITAAKFHMGRLLFSKSKYDKPEVKQKRKFKGNFYCINDSGVHSDEMWGDEDSTTASCPSDAEGTERK